MTIMTKDEVLVCLRSQTSEAFALSKPFRLYAEYFSRYLENPAFPLCADRESLESWLPRCVVRAMECLYLSKKPEDFQLRLRLAASFGVEKVPSLTSISDRGSAQVQLRFELSRRFPVALLGERHEAFYQLMKQLDAYFEAEETVLRQALDRFCLAVYQDGFYELASAAGLSKIFVFGPVQIEVSTFLGPHIQFLFSRIGTERCASYNAYADSSSGKGLWLSQINGNLLDAVSMIDEVIKHWPSVKAALPR